MKKIVALLLAVAMIVACTACGGSSAPAASAPAAAPAAPAASAPAAVSAAEPIVLKWSSSDTPDGLYGKTVTAAFTEIEEKTNGQVKFEYYWENALGSIPEYMEQMLSGSPIICEAGIDTISDYCHDVMPASFPYTYKDINEIFALQKTNWWTDCQKQMNGEDMQAIALTAQGYRHFVGKIKVETADDLKGHIVRMGASTMAQTFMSVVGGSPTTSSWSDNYSLLQNGTIEACEAPTELLWNSSLQEVSKYLNVSAHFIDPCIIVMSNETYASLGEYGQLACDVMTAHFTDMVGQLASTDEEYIQKFNDAGIEVVYTDKSSFNKYLPDLYTALGFDPAIYDSLRAEIEAVK